MLDPLSKSGRYGIFGGQYVAPPLLPVLRAVERAYVDATKDPSFHLDMRTLLQRYVGRPTALYLAETLSRRCAGAKIYLKREDLTSTGGNYVNSVLGQCLLARRMGRSHVITDTGSGQNGVATAAVAARLGLACTVFMGERDMQRQAMVVKKMRTLRADVKPVTGEDTALHQAVSASMQYWMSNSDCCFYVAGAPVGPHPYPLIVRTLQSVIGNEVRSQLLAEEGSLPDVLVAATGGGSSALGLFSTFLTDSRVRLIAVEGGGDGQSEGHHAARLSRGRPGILHGAKTYVLQDEAGQILPARCIAPGLSYPGVAPELAWLRQLGRVETMVIGDEQALRALREIAGVEGILVSLETSHALAAATQLAPLLQSDGIIVVSVTGVGDKDLDQLSESLGNDAATAKTL